MSPDSAQRESPSGWSAARLHELADVIRGVTYQKAEATSTPAADRIGLLRATNIGQEVSLDDLVYVPRARVSQAQELRKGDILIAASSGSVSVVGKAAPIRDDLRLAFGAFCAVVRPDQEVAPFLAQYFRTPGYRSTVSRLAAGVNINNLRRAHLEGLVVPLPPLAEQHRIVAEIEKQFTRLDEGVATLEGVRAKLKRARASVLKAAVEGRLVPTEAELARAEGRSYEPASVLLQRILDERRRRWPAGKKYRPPAAVPLKSELPRLPEGWLWASVEEITTRVVDGVHQKPEYVESGIPFVTVRNLTAGPGISFEHLNHVSREDHAEFAKRANPEAGDILISKDGTLGVVRAVRTQRTFSIFVSVALLKPALAGMTDYLELALASPSVQAQMAPKGSGLQHIHLEDLRQDCVPLPPLTEQARIVAETARRLSVLDALDTTIEENLARCGRLRQSILKRAFEGKLVPQDARDEPASELLARIKAARTNEVTA